MSLNSPFKTQYGQRGTAGGLAAKFICRFVLAPSALVCAAYQKGGTVLAQVWSRY